MDDELPKMSWPERHTVHELDDLRPQNDSAAITNVGLSESGMSAPMAERIEVIHARRSPGIDAGL